MSETLSQIDFNICCRICLKENNLNNKLEMCDLYNENISQGNHVYLQIMNCASVQVLKNDGLPQQVCIKCLIQLDEFCQFKNLIESSDQKLREFLKSKETLNDITEAKENSLELEKTDIHSPQECVNEECDEDDINSEIQNKGCHCNICNKYYKTVDSLRTHKQTHLKQNLKCQNCDKVFTYRRLLKQHMSVHSNEKFFHCQFCNKSFKTKTQLKIHSRRHVNDRPFACSFCDKRFFQISHRNQHLRLHTGEKPFSCDICEEKFRNPTGLVGHKLQKHSRLKNFQCNICQKKFSLKTSLKNHLNLHSQKHFVCEYCGQIFTLLISLKGHLKTHSNENEHNCKECGKKCLKAVHLKDHERTHNSERDFTCTVCGKSFKQPSGLSVHMKTHSTQRTYHCEICDKVFISKQTLEAHKKRHSTLNPLLKQEFLTDICNTEKPFKSKYRYSHWNSNTKS